jgi:hypothetical protein
VARPQKPVVSTVPELTELCQALRQLRMTAGTPTYKTMSAKVLYSPSRLSEAVAGKQMPTWEVTRAYVLACDGVPEDWRERWSLAAEAFRAARRTSQPIQPQEVRTVSSMEVLASRGVLGNPSGGAAAETTTATTEDNLERFNADLRERLLASHHSLRWIASKTGYATSTLSVTLNGSRLPRLQLVQAVLEAIDVDNVEAHSWKRRWTDLAALEQQAQKAAAQQEISSTGRRPLTLVDVLDRAIMSRAATQRLISLILAATIALIAFIAVVAYTVGNHGLLRLPLTAGAAVAIGLVSTLMGRLMGRVQASRRRKSKISKTGLG